MEGKIYIVTAYKFGERNNHSYNLGVFNKKNAAQKAADEHCDYRGRKYSCQVEQCELNTFSNSGKHTKVIYTSKSDVVFDDY
jgi:hypothetical protein